MSGPDCKLCIVGPCRAGKTLLCKVATGQALYPTDMYEPTADAGVRIQAYTTGKAGKGARAELWDCSGDASLAPLWPTLSEVRGPASGRMVRRCVHTIALVLRRSEQRERRVPCLFALCLPASMAPYPDTPPLQPQLVRLLETIQPLLASARARASPAQSARYAHLTCTAPRQLQSLKLTLCLRRRVQGVDGLVLVHSDATRAQEAALEAMYKAFAQAHRITRTRCLVLSCGPLAAGGLTGKLKALPQQAVDLDAAGGPQAAAPRVRAALDALIAQCVQHRAAREEEELAERASSGDEA